MPGFSNSVMFADNVRFDGGHYPGEVTADGQLLIGSTVAPNIRVGSLASSDSSLTITPGAGTIDLSVVSPGASTFSEDSGSASPSSGTLNIHGGTSTGGTTTNINTIGSGSTVSVCLNNSITLPETNSAGTSGVISIGSNTFLHDYSSTAAARNTFVGGAAGNLSMSGAFNTAVGSQSSKALTSGLENSALGLDTLKACTTGSQNVAVGNGSLFASTADNDNTAVGCRAMSSMNGGSYNTAVGSTAMYGNTSGTGNCAIGYQAMFANTGSYNVAIGYGANNQAGTGSDNISIGADAGMFITGAVDNVFIGTSAGMGVTTSSYQVAVGYHAIPSADGEGNVAVGFQGLNQLLTGTYNLALGTNAGYNYTGAETGNILLSNEGVAGDSHAIRIGTQGSSGQEVSTCYIAGIEGVTVPTPQLVTINPSTGQLGSISNTGQSWSVVGVSGSLVPGTSIICTTGAALSFSLPATSLVGDTISLALDGAISWVVTQGAGQSIRIGTLETTPGVGGSITSGGQGATITMVCSIAGTRWVVVSSVGTFLVV